MRQLLHAACIRNIASLGSYTYGTYVQSTDLRNPWVALHKVVIDTLRKQTMDLQPNPWMVSSVLFAKYG